MVIVIIQKSIKWGVTLLCFSRKNDFFVVGGGKANFQVAIVAGGKRELSYMSIPLIHPT
jgi:hypothetical protein